MNSLKEIVRKLDFTKLLKDYIERRRYFSICEEIKVTLIQRGYSQIKDISDNQVDHAGVKYRGGVTVFSAYNKVFDDLFSIKKYLLN